MSDVFWFLAVFIAKLTDPLILIPALPAGVLVRPWPIVLAIAAAAGLLQEWLLVAPGRPFDPATAIIGAIAALAIIAGARRITREIRGK